MRVIVTALAAALPCFICALPGPARACAKPETALGVARAVEIDASAGPMFGAITRRDKEPAFLDPKEVVLTFDDGPVPWITSSILDTLDTFCTKATFFSVGKMALAYPKTLREVLARGHTLGTHTWSHPLSLRRLDLEKATDQIERGFAAVALAAGQPIAPFFRFPGLSDSDALLSHLQTRGIASFTVDVVSNDSYIHGAHRLAAYTLRQVEARQGGIMLFHDIKPATAKALPQILAGLKSRGFTVVHLTSKYAAEPVQSYDAELQPILEKTNAKASDTATLLPFFGAVAPLKSLSGEDLPVTLLAPQARTRTAASEAAGAEAKPHGPAAAKRAHKSSPHGKRRTRNADADSDAP